MSKDLRDVISGRKLRDIDRRGCVGGLAAGAGAGAMLADVAGTPASAQGPASGRTIVITAPTGNVGRRVVANVLESGARIRLIARDPSRLPEDVRRWAELVQG